MVTKKRMVCVVLAAITAGIVLAWSSPVMAADDARMEALERRLAEQEKRIAEQDAKIKRLEGQVDEVDIAPARRAEIEQVIREIEADNAAAKLGDWLENFTLSGDLRARYRARRMNHGHNEANHRRSAWEHGEEVRLRIAGKKTWWDKQMEAGFRLESSTQDEDGNGNATSANHPYGNDANDIPIWIGRAYAKYAPNAVEGLTLIAGKMANPLVTTELLWDTDVNPAGIAASYKYGANDVVQPFVSAAFIEMTNSGSLAAYQAGADVTVAEGLSATGAVAWYDWHQRERTFTADQIASGFAGGNTTDGTVLTAEEFDILDAIFKVKFVPGGDIPTISAFVDYARNCEDQIGQEDEAYAAGLQLGEIGCEQKTGEWFVRYRYVMAEANAFPSFVSDADFMGSDRKGHEVGAGYAISEFLRVEAEMVASEPDDTLDLGESTGAGGLNRARRVQFLLDLIWSW